MKSPVIRFPEVLTSGKCVRHPFSADWFPDDARGGRAVERQRARAREACSGCALRWQCLLMALELEAEEGRSWGIWGGVCARDRHDGLQRMQQGEVVGGKALIEELAEELLNPPTTEGLSVDEPLRRFSSPSPACSHT